MDIALLCLDPGTPLGGADGCSIQLHGLATALARAGHRLRVLSALPTHGDGVPHDLAFERVDLAATHLDAVAQALARARADLVLEPLRQPSTVGASAAGRLGLPHLFLVERAREPAPGGPEDGADVFAASSGAIAFSSEAAHWVRTRAPRHYPIRVTACGVDPALLAPPSAAALARAAATLPEWNGLRVGFAGTLTPGHDLEALVRAVGRARAVMPVQLALMGDGPLRNTLVALAHEHRIGLVLTGTVPHDHVTAYLSRCDVVAVTSREPQGCQSPLKLIEAMAAGRPLVASDTRLAHQHVRDGFDGMLVPMGDEGSLAVAIVRLARTPALRERLGTTAYQSIRRRRSWDDVAGDILGFGLACAERLAD